MHETRWYEYAHGEQHGSEARRARGAVVGLYPSGPDCFTLSADFNRARAGQMQQFDIPSARLPLAASRDAS